MNLLRAGANPNICDRGGRSPLIRAILTQNLTCVKLLLQFGASIKYKTRSLHNPLHLAAALPSISILRELIAAGAEINGQCHTGATRLHYAVHFPPAIQVLLDGGANIDAIDYDGDTPLSDCIYLNVHDGIKKLLERGASCVVLNKYGNTILHRTALHANLKTVETLLSIDIEQIDTNAVNKHGNTAAYIAQTRTKKPEGFLEAFYALLIHICNRNDDIARRVQAKNERREENITADNYAHVDVEESEEVFIDASEY